MGKIIVKLNLKIMPLPAWIEPAAQLVGSGVNALFQGANSRRQAKVARQNTLDTLRHQRELAEYSYSKDLDMWNMANEYNSPSQQMKRLGEAGLNPNLAYGSGSVAGNTSTQTPKYHAYDPQYRNQAVQIPDLTNVMSNFMDLKFRQAQINQTNEVTKGKAIENQFLETSLFSKSRKSFLDYLKTGAELGIQEDLQPGKQYKVGMDSPYMKQFQAVTQQKVNDAALKHLEGNLLKQGVSKTDNMLLRMAVQSGLFDLETLKNMFK